MNKTDLQTELTQATTDAETLRQRRTNLQAELSTVETQERTALNRVTALQRELEKLEREPAAKLQLAQRLNLLHSRLSTAPVTSPTVQQVKSQLARLTDETVSAADRLNRAQNLLDDLENYYVKDRELWGSRTPVLPGRESGRGG